MMKKNGLIIGILILFCTLTTAQDFTISATYGFKTMTGLKEHRVYSGDCGNGRAKGLLGTLTHIQPASKSILATFRLRERLKLALGYQENSKGLSYTADYFLGVQEETYLFRGVTVGFQYDFLKKKRLICHFDSYLTPEFLHSYRGQSQNIDKHLNVSYVAGLGADLGIYRLFYWTTNIFSETALMNYRLDENFSFFPVAFGINSGVKIMF